MSVVIDRDHCIECGFCEKICPKNAIYPHPEYGYIISEDCISCGLCIKKCPVAAIEKRK
jgi:NAD-dependent dihydropyrimidine dehydrogenase PreA subunit